MDFEAKALSAKKIHNLYKLLTNLNVDIIV